MADNSNYIGVAMGLDVTDLKSGISEANKQIQLANSEFKAAASGMDDWTKSTEGLSAKLKQLDTVLQAQKSKLAGLEAEYAKVASEQGENSEAARKLQVQINNQKAVVNQTQREFDNYTETLKQAEDGSIDLESATLKAGKAIDKTGDEAKEAAESTDDLGEGFSGLKAAGGIAAGAVAAVGAACVAAVGAFLGLAESTRESRNEMSKLETSFQSAGLSTEAAEDAFVGLYGIMGDEGAAVEAAQQLAKISDNEADLEANTRILTGVMAEYGNSIPTEGLAEGMAATAAMGEVQGSLADALEWQGVNLEDYNAKLATLSTEEERAAYIQETLTELYGESADAYRENNAEVIAAQEAQARLNGVINELGAIAEPIMTTIKTLAAEVLTSIMPFVELIGKGLTGALSGAEGAADDFAEGLTGMVTTATEGITALLPTLVDVVVSIVPKILTALLQQLPTILTTLVNMVTQVVDALSGMIPTIVAAIMDVLPQLINSLIASIPQLLQAAITFLMALVDAIPVIVIALVEALPSVIQTIIDALVQSIPLLLDAAIQLLNAIIDAIPVLIESLITNLPSIIDTLVNGLVEALPLLLDAAIQLFFAIIDAIPVIVEMLIENLPMIIDTIINALIDAAPKMLECAGELFGKLLEAGKDLIMKLPEVLGNIISTIVNFLIGPFKENFGKMWDGLKDGAKKAWDGVKEIFGKVASFFGDIFGKAWEGVKKIFSTGGKIFSGIVDGILSAFKAIVNAIIRGINKVVAIPFDGINWALEKLKSIDIMGLKPFDWIKTLTVPQIPELEEGGILEKGQIGLLEGKGDEAVIPLERNLGWIRNIAEQLAEYLAFDIGTIKGNAAAFAGAAGGSMGGSMSRNTVINAGMTVNYNGNLSRKQLKQIENDNYTAIRTRLKAEGAF